MTREELKRALGQPPQSYHIRVAETLRELEEEPKMKKMTLRAALLAALIALLAIGIAYAAVSQGLD